MCIYVFACFRFQVDVCKDMNVADVMQHALMDTSSSLARYRIYGSTASLNTLVTSSSRALLDPAAKASRLLHTRHLSMDEIEVPPCLTGASCLRKIFHLECCCGGGRFRRCWLGVQVEHAPQVFLVEPLGFCELVNTAKSSVGICEKTKHLRRRRRKHEKRSSFTQ